jgi:uncharacterized membrane protein YdjX (TVP38/TMEM64 family)
MNNKLKFLVLVIFLALLFCIGAYFRLDIEAMRSFLKKFPLAASGTIFILLYCAVTFFLWLSKDIFKLTAAVLFGAYLSTIFIFIAETINAFILFFFARLLGRGFVEDSLKARYATLDERIGKANFLWLFLLRATPLVPFRFLDLACGLTRISFRRYILAVILGSPLRIFWVQYILAGVGMSVLNRPQALVNYLTSHKAAFIFSLVYLVLVIIVALKLNSRSRQNGG